MDQPCCFKKSFHGCSRYVMQKCPCCYSDCKISGCSYLTLLLNCCWLTWVQKKKFLKCVWFQPHFVAESHKSDFTYCDARLMLIKEQTQSVAGPDFPNLLHEWLLKGVPLCTKGVSSLFAFAPSVSSGGLCKWVVSRGAPQQRCQLFYGLGGVVQGVHKLAGPLCSKPSWHVWIDSSILTDHFH